jgi:hypothetical protein
MSITLERCPVTGEDGFESFHYINSEDCEETFDECWDEATGVFGVRCEGVFYPRCWNGSDYSCVVGDDCCEEYETVSGNCCDDGTGLIPRYLQVAISGISNCGADVPTCHLDDAASLNGTWICERVAGACRWQNLYEVEDGCDCGVLPVQNFYRMVNAYLSGGKWLVKAGVSCAHSLPAYTSRDHSVRAEYDYGEDLPCDILPHAVVCDLDCIGGTSTNSDLGMGATVSIGIY